MYKVVWITKNQVSVNYFYLYTYFYFIKNTKVRDTTFNFSADSFNDQICRTHSIVYILVANSLHKYRWVLSGWVSAGAELKINISSHIMFWTVPSSSTDFHVSHDVYFNVIVCKLYLDVELTFPQTSLNSVLGSWLITFR